MTPCQGEKGPDLVVVGRVGKPHGVRGAVCVHSHAQDPQLFDRLDQVHLLAQDGSDRFLRILSWRHQGKHLVVHFSGIEDRDQAAALTNRDLAVADADLPPPDEDEIYLHQIMGFSVADTQGRDLGRLERFLETPGHEVWIVVHPSGKEILLPATDQVVAAIDPDQGLITVDPPPGLVELYLEDAPPKQGQAERPKPD